MERGRSEGDQEINPFRTTVNVMTYLTELSHNNLFPKRLSKYDLKHMTVSTTQAGVASGLKACSGLCENRAAAWSQKQKTDALLTT